MNILKIEIMANKIFCFLVSFVMAMFFSACNIYNDTPDFTQPIVELTVDNIVDGGVTIGPAKEYEQDSEVIYKLTVTSPKKLLSFSVSSSADAFSPLSKVIQTVPANAINSAGDFTQSLNEVTIYYSFHISPLIPAKTNETLTFTVHDESFNAGFVNHSHMVIKSGSSNGKPLRYIDMTYFLKAYALGLSHHEYILWEGEGGLRQDRNAMRNRGPFFSFKYYLDIMYGVDAVRKAEDIDLAGYRTRYAGTNPVLNNDRFYICSPTDTLLLFSSYEGFLYSEVYLQSGADGDKLNITRGGVTRTVVFRNNRTDTAQDFVDNYAADYADVGLRIIREGERIRFWHARPNSVMFETEEKLERISGSLAAYELSNQQRLKQNIMKRTALEMQKRMRAEGKQLKEVKFMRLDNLTDPAKRVSTADFEGMTHDNEFDEKLKDVWTNGDIRIELVNSNSSGNYFYDAVIGFVINNGSGGRGLIRATPRRIVDLSGTTVDPVPAPLESSNIFYGEIKYSLP